MQKIYSPSYQTEEINRDRETKREREVKNLILGGFTVLIRANCNIFHSQTLEYQRNVLGAVTICV